MSNEINYHEEAFKFSRNTTVRTKNIVYFITKFSVPTILIGDNIIFPSILIND